MSADQRSQIQDLMTRLAGGDRSAFTPSFELLWPMFLRFAERMLINSADAQDAAQTALMKLFSHASEFDSNRDAVAWAMSFVANECRTARQKTRRRRESPEAENRSASWPSSPEESAMQTQLEQAALAALGELSAADQETIRLVVNDSRPQGATFRKRVERAVQRLRSEWSKNHEPD